MNRSLRSEKGFAVLLTVVMLSIVIITSLLSVYTYTTARSRTYAKIKESYKLLNVMEEAGKTVKSGWDLAGSQAISAATSCCNPTYGLPYSGSYYGISSCNTAWGPGTSGCVKDIAFALSQPSYNLVPGRCGGPSPAACCGACPAPGASLCFANPDNNTQPYCFYALTTTQTVQYKIMTPDQFLEPNRFDKFVAKLDAFFEGQPEIIGDPTKTKEMVAKQSLRAPTVWGWILAEKKALASAPTPQPTGPCCGAAGPPNYTTIHFANPPFDWCSNGGVPVNNLGCMDCGRILGVDTLRTCAYFMACPSSFGVQCLGWDGANTNPAVPPAYALFTQEFVLSPPGVCINNNNPATCY